MLCWAWHDMTWQNHAVRGKRVRQLSITSYLLWFWHVLQWLLWLWSCWDLLPSSPLSPFTIATYISRWVLSRICQRLLYLSTNHKTLRSIARWEVVARSATYFELQNVAYVCQMSLIGSGSNLSRPVSETVDYWLSWTSLNWNFQSALKTGNLWII